MRTIFWRSDDRISEYLPLPLTSHHTLGASPATGLEAGWASTEPEPGPPPSLTLLIFLRPIWPPIFCTVQYRPVHYTITAATHQYIALSQSLEASFNFWNKIPERKVSHHCGVAMSQGIMLDLKQKSCPFLLGAWFSSLPNFFVRLNISSFQEQNPYWV